jgi:hypothetical protein
MPFRLLALSLLLLSACRSKLPSNVEDGQEMLHSLISPNDSIAQVRNALSENGIVFAEVPASDCEVTHLEDQFECEGGPALWIRLNDSTRPWNPWYSPSLNAFLAFNKAELLVSAKVALQGGDL